MPKTFQEIAQSEIPDEKKEEFFKKEMRSGQMKVFKGLNEIRKNVLRDDEKVHTAVSKVVEGHNQVMFARRQIIGLRKGKSYWKK